MQKPTDVEEIVFYLRRKREYYEKVLGLTQAQEEAIKSNNVKELNLIITEKGNYIKDINHLDKLNTKIQDEIISNRENLILDKRLNSLLRQLKSIITQVRDYDQDSIRFLNSSIDNTKTKIDNLNRKRRTRISMRKQGIRPASFVNVLQ